MKSTKMKVKKSTAPPVFTGKKLKAPAPTPIVSVKEEEEE